MNRPNLLCILTIAGVVCGGCASQQSVSKHAAKNRSDNYVALTTLEPTHASAQPYTGRPFHLGAGDSLGESIYTNYAMIARANAGWQFAAVEVND